MNDVERTRAALEYEQGECFHERSGAEGRDHIMRRADTYAKESKLAVLAEILREGYTLEQIEDMRRNVEEDVPDAPKQEA